MTLPNLTIPFELPFDVPLLLHPAIIHFVIAVPIVILLLEIINLFFKRRAISVLSLFLIFLVVASMIGAYFTGVADGKEAYPLLASEGQEELKEHKLLGIYLVYGSIALLVFKLIFMAFSQIVARLFFVLILIGFIAVTLIQGKEGGDLVYEYGANNEAISGVEEKLEEAKEDCDEDKKQSLLEKDKQIKALQTKYEALLQARAEEKAESSEETQTQENETNETTSSVEE